DMVIIYFGWNDHLIALGFTDAQQKVGGKKVVRARNILSRSRTYQFLSWLMGRGRAWTLKNPEIAARTALKRRVGRDDFQGEMRKLVRLSRELGAVPLLCTYPTALSYLVQGHRPMPEWLMETHLGHGTPEEMLDLQNRYNDTVRKVARETGAPLVDLEALFAASGKENLFAHPEGDMIHPGDAGYRLIAQALARAVQQIGWKKARPVAP
ncbi:MAG: SGNH/GDSL hydrolase family protein, partial [Acidobacteriota bacterium]